MAVGLTAVLLPCHRAFVISANALATLPPELNGLLEFNDDKYKSPVRKGNKQ